VQLIRLSAWSTMTEQPAPAPFNAEPGGMGGVAPSDSDSELRDSYMTSGPGSTLRRRRGHRTTWLAGLGVILAVGGGSPWWFGWFGSSSSSIFYGAKVPTPTGIYAPTALDETRASRVAAIAGPAYHMISVSRVFVFNRPPAYPGAPVPSVPNSSIADGAWGTDVKLRSRSNLLDVSLEPRSPSHNGLDVTIANIGIGGNLHVLHVEGAFSVGITDYPARSNTALSKVQLLSLESAIWRFYTSASQSPTSPPTKQ
jgi:hypothetical protein